MIRAGRTVVAAAQIGRWRRPPLSVETLYAYGTLTAPGWPAPVSSPRARLRLWDEQQARQAHAGERVEPLPQAEDHEDDLLDRWEAPQLLRNPVSPHAWSVLVRNSPFLRERTVWVGGDGVDEQPGAAHHRRGDILEWDAARPGRGHGPNVGRPTTSVITARRRKAAALVDQAHADGRSMSGRELASKLNVSDATGYRLLKQLRSTAAAP